MLVYTMLSKKERTDNIEKQNSENNYCVVDCNYLIRICIFR